MSWIKKYSGSTQIVLTKLCLAVKYQTIIILLLYNVFYILDTNILNMSYVIYICI